jgi:DNA-binding transcriptional LysR family regulator
MASPRRSGVAVDVGATDKIVQYLDMANSIPFRYSEFEKGDHTAGQTEKENSYILALTRRGLFPMELRHLRYFVAVAEEHSFTRAAERLGIKQPPLSLQIRQLEKEMGTPLFRRLTRRVELTGSGKLLLEEARHILARVEQTKTDVRRRARGETGQIWIGSAGATYFEPMVTTILREFCEQYPSVVLYAEESSTLMLIANVHVGKVDAAFVWSPIAERDNLAVLRIVDESVFVMLPKGHRLERLHAIPLAALAEETFLLFARRMNSVVYDAIIAACRLAGFEPKMGRELPHIFATFPLVAAGRGISLVPQCLTRVHVEGVSFRPIEGDALAMGISLVHRRNDNSSAVQNLVSMSRRLVRSGAEAKKIARAAVA